MILTARGHVDSSEIGPTNFHIHLIAMPPPWLYKTPSFENDPDYILSDTDKAVDELKLLITSGCKTAVDATTRDYGRNAKALKVILDQVENINYILVTGFNRGIYLDRSYYERDEEELADQFISEIEEGIDGTDLKAGLIKIGTDYMRILPIELKCIKAAIHAHLSTKIPIVVHTTLGTMAHEILDLLEKNGVDPRAVIFYHSDRNLDPWYWEDILDRGSYIVIDQIGKIKYCPDGKRAEFIVEMTTRGYGKQILLGTDFARRSDFASYGGGPGLGYLFNKFVPFLRKVFEKNGFDPKQVDEITINNPANALSRR